MFSVVLSPSAVVCKQNVKIMISSPSPPYKLNTCVCWRRKMTRCLLVLELQPLLRYMVSTRGTRDDDDDELIVYSTEFSIVRLLRRLFLSRLANYWVNYVKLDLFIAFPFKLGYSACAWYSFNF